MQALLSQEEWDEYQQLKAEKAARKPNALTGRVITRAEVARPRIQSYLANMSGTRFPMMRSQEMQQVGMLVQDAIQFTFEECTGEKY